MNGELIDILHKIIQESVEGQKPADLVFGTVAALSPLSVTLENTMQPIPEAAIILTEPVIARTVSVTATTTDGARVTVNVPVTEGLKAGERVVMLRCSAGQRFVILSRAQ